MFCGDETGGYVGQIGYSNSRFGWAGEDCPKLTVPSLLTSSGNIGTSALHASRLPPSPTPSSLSASSSSSPSTRPIFADPLAPGTISDWSACEQMWSKSFATLRSDPSAHPLLTMDSSLPSVPLSQRSTTLELLFEKFSVPALYISSAASLAAFSLGRHTALIVDVGGGAVTVTPIVDGLPLRKSTTCSLRGGERMSDDLANKLEKKLGRKLPLAHSSSSASSEVDTAYELYCRRELMLDLKKSCLPMLQYARMDLREVAILIPPNTVYELPDGTPVDINANPDLFCAAEMLYKDKLSSVDEAATVAEDPSSSRRPSIADPPDHPLHKLVSDALALSDVDVRRELCANVVVCGGGTCFQGFDERLAKELSIIAPSSVKCKVATGNAVERVNASWIGGSILTSLGSFQQLWLSKMEYEEFGATLGAQRFS